MRRADGGLWPLPVLTGDFAKHPGVRPLPGLPAGSGGLGQPLWPAGDAGPAGAAVALLGVRHVLAGLVVEAMTAGRGLWAADGPDHAAARVAAWVNDRTI